MSLDTQGIRRQDQRTCASLGLVAQDNQPNRDRGVGPNPALFDDTLLIDQLQSAALLQFECRRHGATLPEKQAGQGERQDKPYGQLCRDRQADQRQADPDDEMRNDQRCGDGARAADRNGDRQPDVGSRCRKSQARRNAKVPLVPPKPKLFLIATSIFKSRAVFAQ
jgi:hypothetical protein